MKQSIKDHCYEYLKGLSDAGETLQKSTPQVNGFIEHLKTKDSDFGKIKPSLRICSYKFVECIRVEIKNKIAKINKELTDAAAAQ